MKPCPFCGGQPRYQEEFEGERYLVCAECGAGPWPGRNAGEDKIKATWNQRHVSSAAGYLGVKEEAITKFAELLEVVR